MTSEIEIRPLAFKDLRQVASINCAAWKAAYTGQIPQEFLDGIDPERQVTKWEARFCKSNDRPDQTLVTACSDVVLGYVSFGPGRRDGEHQCGEIYAIYILPGEWGRGVGHSLFRAAAKFLSDKGFNKAYVLTLDTNFRAQNAYERWGGLLDPDFSVQETIGGKPVTEVCMTFALKD